jgi:hypothetical protein
LRLWTLHPKYLDARGLVALWREALLAQAVLRDRTRGYRAHPQLARFRSCPSPRAAINAYLASIHEEACRRGYGFDRRKLGRVARGRCDPIDASDGQLAHEWEWLLRKLRARNAALFRQHREIALPEPHPLFRLSRGPVADWERP